MTVLFSIVTWAAALAAAVGWGGLLTPAVLRWASKTERAEGEVDSGPAGSEARAVLRGGTWIGMLERAGIVLAIMSGHPEGIALVIAVKGLGRYPELRERPQASERFVIGTLTSMTWAAAVGGAGAAVLSVL